MTRHIISKTLAAASALIVLAAAPSALAGTDKPIAAKVKKSKSVVKVADNSSAKFRSNRSLRSNLFGSSRSLRNNRLRTNSSINRGFNNRSSSSSLFRTSSLLGGSRSFFSPYRSSLGISFSFGSAGYSPYRWSPSAYSLYRPTYGSYASYKRRTVCNRVTLDGLYHGRPALVSVKQCSNPWDGTYIVQGSEKLVDSRW